MSGDLATALARRFGATIADAHPVAGGDINAAYRVDLDDGRRLFVKTNSMAPAGMFAVEARGLEWLAAARTLRTPEVLGWDDTREGGSYLALEWIEPDRPGRDFEARLGRGLARLHRAGAPTFGLDHDNYIGSLPQTNTPAPTWAEFYAQRRLRPQLEAAERGRRLAPATVYQLESVLERMAEWVGPAEPPARLHGDLWSGNVLCDEAGAPCLLDPAAYGGHREVDLAMWQLFGYSGEDFFAAYAEEYPLAPGWRARMPLYQLYPLLVHVNLFGGPYASRLTKALRDLRLPPR